MNKPVAKSPPKSKRRALALLLTGMMLLFAGSGLTLWARWDRWHAYARMPFLPGVTLREHPKISSVDVLNYSHEGCSFYQIRQEDLFAIESLRPLLLLHKDTAVSQATICEIRLRFEDGAQNVIAIDGHDLGLVIRCGNRVSKDSNALAQWLNEAETLEPFRLLASDDPEEYQRGLAIRKEQGEHLVDVVCNHLSHVSYYAVAKLRILLNPAPSSLKRPSNYYYHGPSLVDCDFDNHQLAALVRTRLLEHTRQIYSPHTKEYATGAAGLQRYVCELLAALLSEQDVEELLALLQAAPPESPRFELLDLARRLLHLPPSEGQSGICGNSTPSERAAHARAQKEQADKQIAILLGLYRQLQAANAQERDALILGEWDAALARQPVNIRWLRADGWRTVACLGDAALAHARIQQKKGPVHDRAFWQLVAIRLGDPLDHSLVHELIRTGEYPNRQMARVILHVAWDENWESQYPDYQPQYDGPFDVRWLW